MAQLNAGSSLEDKCLTDAEFSELPNYTRNKVRDTYKLPDGQRLLITTDRQSAFDQVLAAVPFKGQVLTQIARYWFEETKDICPNHVISYPDPNVVLAKDLEMLPIEIVVRSYLTGSTNTSIWPMYQRGERVIYGHKFPDGMRKNQKLAAPIITPTTKPADGGHDAPITEAEILDTQLLTPAQWHEISAKSLALFKRGQALAAEKGLILVDTKYEFGVDEDGVIVVADEIHTPDSSRIWLADSYQQRFDAGEEPDSLDKEFLRLWVAGQCDPYKDPIPEIPQETLLAFSEKYIALYEKLTGQAFERPDISISVRDRIHQSLVQALPAYF
ncbi:phosphoribosylaminoimidazolesuccinocarboxamide synthase [Maritalea myrionectae]|uniref:phosphoribosylaminoimidazolesuccinocarboxamide synthase n=1 Tax=Maritalea myrionectae TaxID=454601 RepID=UPI0004176DAB|nr:phosphoribosylaminoimidazolesuccinocarboxamide synthase [Maritalea myrionectae]